ncbi:MAG: hypothetical protein Q8K65_12615 [Alphaproteobacteria bacterium]|nr:hypothetical protein [Alphaproteobacteria bacterium]
MKFCFLIFLTVLFSTSGGQQAFASCAPRLEWPLWHSFIIFLSYLLGLFVVIGGSFSFFKFAHGVLKREAGWRSQLRRFVPWPIGFIAIYGVFYSTFFVSEAKRVWPSRSWVPSQFDESHKFDSYSEYLSVVVMPALAQPVVFIFFCVASIYVVIFYVLKRRGLCSQVNFRIALIALAIWLGLYFNLVDLELKPRCCSTVLDLTTASCPISRPCLRCG